MFTAYSLLQWITRHAYLHVSKIAYFDFRHKYNFNFWFRLSKLGSTWNSVILEKNWKFGVKYRACQKSQAEFYCANRQSATSAFEWYFNHQIRIRFGSIWRVLNYMGFLYDFYSLVHPFGFFIQDGGNTIKVKNHENSTNMKKSNNHKIWEVNKQKY